MREYKFRGKEHFTPQEWVYGHLSYDYTEKCYHITSKGKCPISGNTITLYREVLPETIGQFTGLLDKNGKEIYEGDIIHTDGHFPPNYLIEFIEGGFCATHPNVAGYPTDINHFYPSGGCTIEVIGNIHETKGLLK